MADVDRLTLQVLPLADSDEGELADLAGIFTPSCSEWMRPQWPRSPLKRVPCQNSFMADHLAFHAR
jgi:hypothetical protein